ncbi:MAG: histidine phosphatase family protein [Gemmiger sp.]|nr:histidine phosphatase family protein [Gemmiger sp.]
MKLIFVRHGDPDYTHDSLTAAGRAEAAALNQRLRSWQAAGMAWDSFVSPLGRAQLTARLALEGTGNTPVTLPWLEEFRGRLANGDICWDLPPKRYAEDKALFCGEDWMQAPIYQGTNVGAIHAETRAGLDELLAGYGYQREGRLYRVAATAATERIVVLFCHMAITLDSVACLLSLPAPVLWQQVLLPPASLTILGTEEHQPGYAQWRVQCMGDVRHLSAAGVPVSSSGSFTPIFAG